MVNSSNSNSFSVQVSIMSDRDFKLRIDRHGKTYRMLRGFLLFVVLITFMGNCLFILDAASNIFSVNSDQLDKARYRLNTKLLPGIERDDEDEDRLIRVEVLSSKENVSITVNGKTVNDVGAKFTGILVIVLNQVTGAEMASNMIFDTYTYHKESQRLTQFIEEVTPGRIICFATKDEASRSLTKKSRLVVKSLGSMYFNHLQWRDSWAFVVQKRKQGGRVLAEGYQKCPNPYVWPSPVRISTSFLAAKNLKVKECPWNNTKTNQRRKEFCGKYEVYSTICRCSDPASIVFDNPPFPDGTRLDIPIVVMAGNRPRYLLRMLLTLKSVIGLDVSMVTIYIDGFYEEVLSVGKLFNLKVVRHAPLGRASGKVSQHYKKGLTTSFDQNPHAKYLVVLEEDLDVSPDILVYFKQLLPVLDKDDTLFCISAWNDIGYKHSVKNLSLTYRVEFMPGLGWVLPRKIYKTELEQDWPSPDKLWDWDMWIRKLKLNGRECIIPDISRTFHFGARGVNMNPYFQSLYFDNHAFNKEDKQVKIDVDLMYKDNYEMEVQRLIRSATLLNHTMSPCSHPNTFIPNTRSKTYVYYIEMNGDYKSWLNTARCFKLWDLDVRCCHKGMFRFWSLGNHVIVIGCPDSPYCKLKPSHIIPIKVRS